MSAALRCLASVAFVLVLCPSFAFAQQQSKSAALASELAKLLDEMKLDSVAAAQNDQFVGALYIPGSQLLVVSAKAQPARINYLIAQKAYRDAYIDLNGTTEVATKVLISDLGANGLRFKRENNGPSDIVDADGKSVSFDGDWGKAKISESDYTRAWQTYDEQYSKMLETLLAALKKPS